MTSPKFSGGKNFFERIYEFAYGSQQDYQAKPMEIIEEELKEAGINSQEAYKKLIVSMEKQRKLMRLQKAGDWKEAILKKINSICSKDTISGTKEEMLKKLLGDSLPQLAFRKYEKCSEEDLRSLLEDIKILELLEELEKDDEHKS